MKISIVIISANELRHKFFRRKISLFKNIDVKLCLAEKNSSRQHYKIIRSNDFSKAEKKHFLDRQKSEKKYFSNFLKKNSEIKNLKIIDRGEFNLNKSIINEIFTFNPDLIISFGCSIIKKPIVTKYRKKFINIHLGLSPYYKGSATNFWPLVNNEPQFLGVSFLKIDKGIDTGPIIHQIRPDLHTNDDAHDIGNKLIIKTVKVLEKLVLNYKNLKGKKQKKIKKEKIFKKKDYSELALKKMKLNFENNLIKKYLNNKSKLDKKFPIIEQNL